MKKNEKRLCIVKQRLYSSEKRKKCDLTRFIKPIQAAYRIYEPEAKVIVRPDFLMIISGKPLTKMVKIGRELCKDKELAQYCSMTSRNIPRLFARYEKMELSESDLENVYHYSEEVENNDYRK